MLARQWPTARTTTSEPVGCDDPRARLLRDSPFGGWHMGALRDVEFFLADHDRCGGVEVCTCPPTSVVGYYLAVTCCCGAFRVKWAMSEQALFNLVWPIQPYTPN